MLSSTEIRRQLVVYEQKLNMINSVKLDIKKEVNEDQIKYSVILHALEQAMPIKPTIHINQLYGDCGSNCQDRIIYSCSEFSIYVQFLDEVNKETTTTHATTQKKQVACTTDQINCKKSMVEVLAWGIAIMANCIIVLVLCSSCIEEDEDGGCEVFGKAILFIIILCLISIIIALLVTKYVCNVEISSVSVFPCITLTNM